MLFSPAIHKCFFQHQKATSFWIFYRRYSYKHVQTIRNSQALKLYWLVATQKCLGSSYQVVNQRLLDSTSNTCGDDDGVSKKFSLLLKLKKSQPFEKVNSKVIEQLSISTLNEKDSSFLLSLCEKRIDSVPSERVKYAELIFEGSETKSIDLFNQLLLVYLENNVNISSSRMLTRLQDMKLVPNQKTYLSLIAQYCLNGDINGAVDFSQKSNFKLTNDVYGYIAYGLCKNGKCDEAVKLLDKAMVDSFSIDGFCWLLSGLVNAKAFDLFHSTIEKYGFCLKSELSITQVLKIYEKLVEQDKYKDIEQLVSYLTVTKDDFSLASNYLQNVHIHASAFFIRCLYENYEETLMFSEASPLKIIFRSFLRNGLTLDQVFDEVQKFSKFYSDPQFIDYFALSVIAEEQSWIVFDYLCKLKSNNKILTYPVPPSLSEFIDLPPLLKRFLSDFNIFHNNDHLQRIVENINFTLFPESFHEISVKDVFGIEQKLDKHSKSSPFDLILYSFVIFFKKFGSQRWSMSKLSWLLHDLHDAGFHLDKDDLEYLQFSIDPKHSFLVDIMSCNGDLANLASQPTKACLHQKDLTKVLSYSKFNVLSSLSDYDTKSFMQAIQDFVIDDNNAFNSGILDYMSSLCNRQKTSFPMLLNLILCQHLSSGQVDLAKVFMSNVDKDLLDLKVKIVPSSILKSRDFALNQLVLSFLKEHYGYDVAMWVYFISFLKAGMANTGFKILAKNLQTVTHENCENFLLSLCNEKDFPNYVTTFFHQCNGLLEFEPDTFYLNAVELLLQQKRNFEAKKLLSSEKWIKKHHTTKELYQTFLRYQQFPPYHSVPGCYRELKLILQKDNVDHKHFYALLNRLKCDQTINFYLFSSLLIDFYKKIAADEYGIVTKKIQSVVPTYLPAFQSQVLLNQIEKLCKLNLAKEAFEFADKNLKKCSTVNVDIWDSAIRLLGNVVVLKVDSTLMQQLQDLASTAFPKIQSLASSYKLYLLLQSKDIQARDEEIVHSISEVSMLELISLITSKNDVKAFSNLKIAVLSALESKPDLLKEFIAFSLFNNFEIDQIIGLLKDEEIGFDHNFISAIASLGYSLPDNEDKLIKLDQLYREIFVSGPEMHGMFNHLLFNKFACSFNKFPSSEKLIQYLTKQYHVIPSSRNTLYSQTVYVDLLTNVKFGCFGNENHLCVYH